MTANMVVAGVLMIAASATVASDVSPRDGDAGGKHLVQAPEAELRALDDTLSFSLRGAAGIKDAQPALTGERVRAADRSAPQAELRALDETLSFSLRSAAGSKDDWPALAVERARPADWSPPEAELRALEDTLSFSLRNAAPAFAAATTVPGRNGAGVGAGGTGAGAPGT